MADCLIKKHLFLTGDKQVGKSTLLRTLIEEAKLDCSGFETRPFYIHGERRGFTLHGRVDMPAFENDCIVSVRCAQQLSVPVLHVFDHNGVDILQRSLKSPAPFILMDEIGKLECSATAFIDQLELCLNADKRVIGVLQKCQAPHIEQILSRDDVSILTVTEQNRNDLLNRLCRQFR